MTDTAGIRQNSSTIGREDDLGTVRTFQKGFAGKIAVLSDIHANIQALEAVLRDCEEQGADEFWMLGDYIDYGGSPVETMRRLETLNIRQMIAGNHDACLYLDNVRSSATPHGRKACEFTRSVVMRNRRRFSMLEAIVHRPMAYVPECRTLLVHGTPEDPYWGKFQTGNDPDDLFRAMEDRDAKIMLMGHSHVSSMLMKDGRRIINPGSVGQPRDGCPDASYIILEKDTVMFRRVSYDIDAAAAAIQQAGLPEYLWKRLYEGK